MYRVLWIQISAVGFSPLMGGIILYVSGNDPIIALIALARRAFGSLSAVQRILEKSTPLIFNGLAVAFAFKAGVFAGLAGAFHSLEAVGSFERAMTAGRGFIALAVMIFARWRPLGAWGVAFIFGLAAAIQTQLQFGGHIHIPHQFIGMLPYLLTVFVMAAFVGRVRPPAAIGKPYIKA